MKKYFSHIIFLLLPLSLLSQNLNVIPKPLKAKVNSDVFIMNEKTVIGYNDKKLSHLAGFLNNFIGEHYHLKLVAKKTARSRERMVYFLLDETAEKESYTLNIDQNTVVIKGNEAGIFYGLQTLLQLMPISATTTVALPQISIEDKPRFKYRGAMLDVGRYFFTPIEVKKFLDLMAHYKLNTFHWHLTEDAGWRIQIDQYPLLTEIGSWRRGTQRSRAVDSFDKLPHGGFYTKEQIKDIVHYAAERYINVIPEIDMPGHTLSILAAYPELSCSNGTFKVLENWGIQKDVLCAGNDQTYIFIENILDEILEMFPSQIIHIGGDEAPKDRWKVCPKCQEKIRSEGLKDEKELQGYFVNRVGAYLQSKGRKMLGWDEIMEGGLAENAMVMSWRGEKGGIEAAKLHHEVVMTPNSFMYLDYYQGNKESEPYSIGGNLPLEKVYSFDPLSQDIPVENHHYIIGIQGNLWMEYIHSESKLEYMAFPRLLAVAEIGWSDAKKDFRDFSGRLSHNLLWLEKKGINFRIPDVICHTSKEVQDNRFILDLHSPMQGASIYYALNDDPMQNGILYTAPVKISLDNRESLKVNYILRTPTGRVSSIRTLNFEKK